METFLTIRDKVNLRTHRSLLAVLLLLALVVWQRDRVGQMLVHSAGAIRSLARVPASVDYAARLNELGLTFAYLGYSETAKALLDEALGQRQATGAGMTADHARFLWQQAHAYATLGRWQDYQFCTNCILSIGYLQAIRANRLHDRKLAWDAIQIHMQVNQPDLDDNFIPRNRTARKELVAGAFSNDYLTNFVAYDFLIDEVLAPDTISQHVQKELKRLDLKNPCYDNLVASMLDRYGLQLALSPQITEDYGDFARACITWSKAAPESASRELPRIFYAPVRNSILNSAAGESLVRALHNAMDMVDSHCSTQIKMVLYGSGIPRIECMHGEGWNKVLLELCRKYTSRLIAGGQAHKAIECLTEVSRSLALQRTSWTIFEVDLEAMQRFIDKGEPDQALALCRAIQSDANASTYSNYRAAANLLAAQTCLSTKQKNSAVATNARAALSEAMNYNKEHPGELNQIAPVIALSGQLALSATSGSDWPQVSAAWLEMLQTLSRRQREWRFAMHGGPVDMLRAVPGNAEPGFISRFLRTYFACINKLELGDELVVCEALAAAKRLNDKQSLLELQHDLQTKELFASLRGRKELQANQTDGGK